MKGKGGIKEGGIDGISNYKGRYFRELGKFHY